MKLNINKDLLPMKGHYFLFNAGVAPVQPFMSVIAKNLNFSSKAYGTISGILPFTGMLAKPLFGAIADRFRLHKAVFIAFQFLTILGFFNIQFLSKIEDKTENKVKLVCGAETNFDVCFKQPSKRLMCLMNDVLEEGNLNKTVLCSLRCDLSPELRTELCGSWKANPKICTEDILRSEYNKYSYLQEHSDNYSLSTPLDDVKLEFVATVHLRHTLKVADCMYFRVTRAKLNDETDHIPYCTNEADTRCIIHCEDSKLSDLLNAETNKEPDEDFARHHQFWLFLVLAIVSWVGMAVVGSVADAVCFELLGEKASHYGYQRLWGSIGWGVSAIIAGLLVDAVSTDGNTNFTPVYYMMLVLIICDVVCSYNLKYQQMKVCSNILKNVTKLLKDFWIDVFLVWCIIVGVCVGVQWNFLFWYEYIDKLTEECEYNSTRKTLLGLISGVQCFLGELPSFFVFGWLVKKVGHVHLMTFIPFVVGIRFILYSVISNPWWILPVELLQSSLGLSFATMASYASIVAPPGAEATVQGLVGAIFEGIGVSLGSYLGGVIIAEYGGKELFQIFAVLAFSLSVAHGTVHYLLGRNSKLQTQAKDFNGVAKYATPNEAVSMLEDT